MTPYVGSDQGHYNGYTQEDFYALLASLEATKKGRFLLSSYRNKVLAGFTERNGWHTVESRMACAMNNMEKNKKSKVEMLTANYPIRFGS